MQTSTRTVFFVKLTLNSKPSKKCRTAAAVERDNSSEHSVGGGIITEYSVVFFFFSRQDNSDQRDLYDAGPFLDESTKDPWGYGGGIYWEGPSWPMKCLLLNRMGVGGRCLIPMVCNNYCN